MGIPPPSLHPSLDLLGSGDHSPSGPFWIKALRLQAMKRSQQRKLRFKKNCRVLGWNKRPKILKKRRALLEGSRRPMSGVEGKIRSLQKLVPDGECMGLDGLFRETADYIMSLQMQVKIMQVMVEVFSDSNK